MRQKQIKRQQKWSNKNIFRWPHLHIWQMQSYTEIKTNFAPLAFGFLGENYETIMKFVGREFMQMLHAFVC